MTAKTISTGIEGLDQILRGGIPPNNMYLLAGTPGTGKTTLALQFLLEGLHRGEAGLYVTLSQTKSELLAVAESHNWSLEGLAIYDRIVPQKQLSEDRYTIFHPSEVELGDTMSALLEEVDRLKPKRIILDSVSEMRLLAHDSLRFRRQVLALKTFFNGRDSTVFLLDDYTGSSTDPQLEGLVHGVITLDFDNPGYGSPRRHLRVLKLRGAQFTGGYHDFNIEKGGVVVFPRIKVGERESHRRENFKSGVEAMDGLIGGGMDSGTATLMIGPAGAGKSTLAAQYIHTAAQTGCRGAYFTFDEGVSTMLARTSALGINVVEDIKAGTLTLRQIDPGKMSPGEFSHIVRQSVETDGARLVVIDSLNGYYQAMPDGRFLSSHMNDLLAYLGQHDVLTIIIVEQHGLFGTTGTTPVDMSYMADTVILLRYFESAGEVRQAISISKKRSGPHERSIREFKIGTSGIQVGEPLKGFQGVLTGVPDYRGQSGKLIAEKDRARNAS
jgi:circadian clock protein KaiC